MLSSGVHKCPGNLRPVQRVLGGERSSLNNEGKSQMMQILTRVVEAVDQTKNLANPRMTKRKNPTTIPISWQVHLVVNMVLAVPARPMISMSPALKV